MEGKWIFGKLKIDINSLPKHPISVE